jgi:hypothetical protein
MSSFSDYTENKVLDHIHGGTAFTQPAAQYLELYTAAPTDAGGGTVVTGGGYARQAVTFGAASGGAVSNTGAVTFTASGSDYSGDVVAVGLFDAITGGNFLWWDGITAATITDGDSLTFAIGDIDVTLT